MATIRKHGQQESLVDDLAAVIAERVRARIIAAIDEAFDEVSSRPAERGVREGRHTGPRRRASSPAMARARKVQGQYLGALRTLTGDARKKVKALAQSEGVGPALALARSLSKKK